MSARRTLHVVGGALVEDGRCLVARRGPAMALAGRWEFPGGKVESRERPAVALRRELHEELGLDVEVGEWIGRGDVYEDGRRIVLDVYAARSRGGELTLHEHDDARWLAADELGGLRWAAADIPVLPAVREHLERDGPEARDGAHRAARPICVLSADWSKGARKRAAFEARPDDGGWTVSIAPTPRDGWTLAALLERAQRIRGETGRGVWIGIDACIGLPAAFLSRACAPDFETALLELDAAGGLADGAEAGSAESWSTARPFFRVPAGHGALTRFQEAAGGRATLLRAIELRTGAKTVFAVSGIPGTVGSGSRALWQELVPLLAPSDRDFRIWPFEGSVRDLTEDDEIAEIVVAETYPRASYAVALEEQLPARPRALAKTRASARRVALELLSDAIWRRAHRVTIRQLEAAEVDEDPFDALMACAALVRLMAEGRPLSCPLVDPVAEGGILGTGDVSLAARPRPPRS